MTDEPEKTALVPQEPDADEFVDDPRQLDLFRKSLEVELRRIESHDRRTELGHAFVKMQDTADERQYNFHTEKLRYDNERSARLYSLARNLFGVGGLFSVIYLAFVIIMMFYGTPDQQKSAETLLRYTAAAIGGGGVVYLLGRIARWLTGL